MVPASAPSLAWAHVEPHRRDRARADPGVRPGRPAAGTGGPVDLAGRGPPAPRRRVRVRDVLRGPVGAVLVGAAAALRPSRHSGVDPHRVGEHRARRRRAGALPATSRGGDHRSADAGRAAQPAALRRRAVARSRGPAPRPAPGHRAAAGSGHDRDRLPAPLRRRDDARAAAGRTLHGHRHWQPARHPHRVGDDPRAGRRARPAPAAGRPGGDPRARGSRRRGGSRAARAGARRARPAARGAGTQPGPRRRLRGGGAPAHRTRPARRHPAAPRRAGDDDRPGPGPLPTVPPRRASATCSTRPTSRPRTPSPSCAG